MTPNRTLPPAAAAARIASLLITLAGLAIAIGGQWLWRHRRQIGAALVATAAATYSAGAWLRQQIEALATDSARRIPAQPITALSPITATLAAAWGLVDRFTTTRAKRAQQALLADIANAYGLEPRDLLRPIEFGYSTAAVAAAWGLVDRGAMTRSDRARQALLADIASDFGLELRDLLRPIGFGYSAAAVAAAWELANRVTTARTKRSQWARLRTRLTQQPNAARAHDLELRAPLIPQTELAYPHEWARRHGWTLVE